MALAASVSPVDEQSLKVGLRAERILVHVRNERLALHVADVLGDDRLRLFQLGLSGAVVARVAGSRQRIRQAVIDGLHHPIELEEALVDLLHQRRRRVGAVRLDGRLERRDPLVGLAVRLPPGLGRLEKLVGLRRRSPGLAFGGLLGRRGFRA